MSATDQTRLVELPREECLRLLAAWPLHLGRLVFVHEGRPVALPVNFRMDGDAVVFRTAPGSAVHAAVGEAVAFQIDAIDAAWEEGWSVLLHGVAEEVTEPEDIERVERLPLRTWAPGARDRYVRVAPTDVTGRRII